MTPDQLATTIADIRAGQQHRDWPPRVAAVEFVATKPQPTPGTSILYIVSTAYEGTVQ